MWPLLRVLLLTKALARSIRGIHFSLWEHSLQIEILIPAGEDI